VIVATSDLLSTPNLVPETISRCFFVVHPGSYCVSLFWDFFLVVCLITSGISKVPQTSISHDSGVRNFQALTLPNERRTTGDIFPSLFIAE